MSNYVQLGNVHTYYEEDGEGEALVLLHRHVVVIGGVSEI